MLHITSARCVKLRLHRSNYALLAKGTVLWCLLCLVVFSSIPISISLYCLYLILIHSTRSDFFHSPLVGSVDWFDSGKLIINSNSHDIIRSDLIWSNFFIAFKLSNQKHVLLWRDSCDEKCYRKILAKLR
ncbi:protein YgfX [Vibrio kagoshimensis]|uniref:protein YgfX n=1 Tax=Vibrio kagoshimensis TaxID=2910244 RepID=UPI003D1F2322